MKLVFLAPLMLLFASCKSPPSDKMMVSWISSESSGSDVQIQVSYEGPEKVRIGFRNISSKSVYVDRYSASYLLKIVANGGEEIASSDSEALAKAPEKGMWILLRKDEEVRWPVRLYFWKDLKSEWPNDVDSIHISYIRRKQDPSEDYNFAKVPEVLKPSKNQ